jgi:hypothetical protein
MIAPGDVVYLLRSLYQLRREQTRLLPSPNGLVGRNGLPLSPEDFKQELADFFGSRYPRLAAAFQAKGGADTPLRGVISSTVSTVDWEESGSPGAGRLTIRPTVSFTPAGVLCLVFAGGMSLAFFTTLARDLHALAHSLYPGSSPGPAILLGVTAFLHAITLVAMTAVCGVVGIFLLAIRPKTLIFDGVGQSVFQKEDGPTHARPFSDIQGLQLLGGIPFQTARGGMQRNFQLNLVLSDPAKPRFNICEHGDAKSIDELAERLARFIEKPVVRSP